jgi:predicted RNA-binding Zn ribbon-like protein
LAYAGVVTNAGVGLGTVEEFLNTLDERTFRVRGEQHVPSDRLSSPQALAEWLDTHGLGRPVRAPGQEDLALARELRAAVRASLGPPSAGDAEVARALGAFPLRLRPDGSGLLRLTADTGLVGLDALVEAVAVGAASGSWKRVKLCASEDCRWAFYDTSRSGGGRWCNMEICGNRHKTRAYRRRRTAT